MAARSDKLDWGAVSADPDPGRVSGRGGQEERLDEMRRRRRWGCFVAGILVSVLLIVVALVMVFTVLRAIPATPIQSYLASDVTGIARLHIETGNRGFQARRTARQEFLQEFFSGFIESDLPDGEAGQKSRVREHRTFARFLGAMKFLFHPDLYLVMTRGDEYEPEHLAAIVMFRRRGKVLRFFLREPYDVLTKESEQVYPPASGRVGAAAGFPIYRNSARGLFFAITDREAFIGTSQHVVEGLLKHRASQRATDGGPSARFMSYLEKMMPQSRGRDLRSDLLAGFVVNENDTFDRLIEWLEWILPESNVDFALLQRLCSQPEAPEALSFSADFITRDVLKARVDIHCPTSKTAVDVIRFFERQVLAELQEALEGIVRMRFQADQDQGTVMIRLTVEGLRDIVRSEIPPAGEVGRELR